MTKENENVSIANKSSYTEEEIKAAYEKGKSEGRIEGMLSYQKRLIKNLQQDNASLNQMLHPWKSILRNKFHICHYLRATSNRKACVPTSKESRGNHQGSVPIFVLKPGH